MDNIKNDAYYIKKQTNMAVCFYDLLSFFLNSGPIKSARFYPPDAELAPGELEILVGGLGRNH